MWVRLGKGKTVAAVSPGLGILAFIGYWIELGSEESGGRCEHSQRRRVHRIWRDTQIRLERWVSKAIHGRSRQKVRTRGRICTAMLFWHPKAVQIGGPDRAEIISGVLYCNIFQCNKPGLFVPFLFCSGLASYGGDNNYGYSKFNERLRFISGHDGQVFKHAPRTRGQKRHELQKREDKPRPSRLAFITISITRILQQQEW
jgi:hypothetical protein